MICRPPTTPAGRTSTTRWVSLLCAPVNRANTSIWPCRLEVSKRLIIRLETSNWLIIHPIRDEQQIIVCPIKSENIIGQPNQKQAINCPGQSETSKIFASQPTQIIGLPNQQMPNILTFLDAAQHIICITGWAVWTKLRLFRSVNWKVKRGQL